MDGAARAAAALSGRNGSGRCATRSLTTNRCANWEKSGWNFRSNWNRYSARPDRNMDIDPGNLPDEPAALKRMIASLLEDREAGQRRLRQLQHLLEQLLRYRYGPRRQRV